MKKFLFIAAALCLWSSIDAQAGKFLNIPTGPSGQMDSADYGGVQYSTITFSTSPVFCFSGEGVVYGAVVSSNTDSRDFLVFYDSGTNNFVPNYDSWGRADAFARVHLSTFTESTVINDAHTTYVKFPKPIRVEHGLKVRASVETINLITVLWEKWKND